MKILCFREIWPRSLRILPQRSLAEETPESQQSFLHLLLDAVLRPWPCKKQKQKLVMGILFLLVFVTFILTVAEGCFEDKRKSKMHAAFMSGQVVGNITPKFYFFMVFLPFISSSYSKEKNENFNRTVVFLFPGFIGKSQVSY